MSHCYSDDSNPKVGADLFGIYEESEVLSPDNKSSSLEKPKPPNQRLVRTASMISPDEVPFREIVHFKKGKKV